MSITFDGNIVFVADVQASAKLYEGGLGLVREWADDNHVQFKLPTKGNMEGAWLLLHPTSVESKPQYLGYFAVEDVDATVTRLQKTGFTITEQPSDAPWGVRQATVTDPDGNGLTLNAPLSQ